MLNITNIPAPRVNIIDERTGLISREWYRFFLNLFTLVGQGNNQTSLDDLQIGPPAQQINVVVSGGGADVAPPSPMTSIQQAVNELGVAPPALQQFFAELLGTTPPAIPVDLSSVGTVTSVNVSGGTTGLTFSGGPITTSGTITMAGTLGTANGGTGATSLTNAGIVTTTDNQTIIGQKTFSNASNQYNGTWAGSVIGTAYGGTGATSLTGAGIVTTTDTQTISGQKNFTSYTNTFRGTTYATSDGGSGSNAYFGESGAYATVGGVNGVVFALGASFPGTGKVVVATNSLRPYSDNSISCGIGAQRWTEVYAVNGTINTSDATEKQQVRELLDAEMRVAKKVKGLIRAFKWNDAVEKKGDGARIHFGVMAQDVQAAFASEGLDASNYGLFCSDTWTTLDGTSQTRLGVRYDELLAFVLAAI